MKLHRFFIKPGRLELTHNFWVNDQTLYNQWTRVLRMRPGDQLVLFDGIESDRLYKISEIDSHGVRLEHVTDMDRKLPNRHVYLFFSLLKKDKNDWVLQKCTELGVSNFVPILADRSEKTGFNTERAQKILTEAAEQCGRSDIPDVREPILVSTAIQEYKDKIQLLVCDETLNKNEQMNESPVGIFIGPEGGWTEKELELFETSKTSHFHLGNLTLRAETAAVTASVRLLS